MKLPARCLPALIVVAASALVACEAPTRHDTGAQTPGRGSTPELGTAQAPVNAACTDNTFGFPCDPGTGNECEGVCWLDASGNHACVPVAQIGKMPADLNGRVCGDATGADCSHSCNNGKCVSKNAEVGTACSFFGGNGCSGRCTLDLLGNASCAIAPMGCGSMKRDGCVFQACAWDDNKSGCVSSNLFTGTGCDDGDKCTSNDACNSSGKCEGTAVSCPAGCTCDPGDGMCMGTCNTTTSSTGTSSTTSTSGTASGTASTGTAGTASTGTAGTASTGTAGTASTGTAGTASTGATMGTASTGNAGTAATGGGTGAGGSSASGAGGAAADVVPSGGVLCATRALGISSGRDGGLALLLVGLVAGLRRSRRHG